MGRRLRYTYCGRIKLCVLSIVFFVSAPGANAQKLNNDSIQVVMDSLMGRTVVIKTHKLFLKKKNCLILWKSSPQRGGWLEHDEYNLFCGRIHVDIDWNDTLYFKIRGYAPIVIEGLKKIKGDKITITNIHLQKYTPVDTSIIDHIPYSHDTVDSKNETVKVSYPNNSLKKIKDSLALTINGVLYHLVVKSKYRCDDTWACTPGKVAYHIVYIGYWKDYILKL